MPYSNKSKKLIKKILGMSHAQSYVIGMKVNEANFGWQGLAKGQLISKANFKVFI